MRLSALVAAAALLASGCHGAKEAEDEGDAGAPATVVARVTEAHRGDIEDVFEVIGETAALTVVRLASPAAGRITFLRVNPGDHVEKGKVVARLVPLENEAAARGLSLLGSSGTLRGKDVGRAAEASRRLEATELSLAAPFSGVVSARLRNPAEQVAGADTLLEIYDPRSMVMLVQVPQDVASRVRAGMEARLAGASFSMPGRVDAVLSAADAGTLNSSVRILPEHPPDPPLLHLPVRCQLVLDRHRDVLLLPREAVSATPGASSGQILAVIEGRARRRDVALGLRSRDAVEILSGLGEGQPVVVGNTTAIPDGTTIQNQPAETPAPEKSAP